ncbi:MAG: M15 family metallopeptidase [Clostridiales bacterium]|jgi:D-alanyl-D-alanine carboxypeptidase|nr:M15 family metallopeptidase [Clostridiales bacterium]
MAKHMKKERKRSRGRTILTAFLALLVLGGTFCAGWYFGVDSTRYKGAILLVNAENTLSPDYVPEALVNLYEQRHSFRLASSDIRLTRDTYEAMERMFAAAEADNVNGFIVTSGYRTYERQREIYEQSEPGYAQAPGASEHQTGLAFDVTAENSGSGFEGTAQYAWLRQHAHEYGFIQRYPANRADVTGISYEPWHFRYVGVEVAAQIHEKGLTLEEFLGK